MRGLGGLISLFLFAFTLTPISVPDGQISSQKPSLEEKIKNADVILIGRVGSVQGPDMPVEEFIGQAKKMAQSDLTNKRDEAN